MHEVPKVPTLGRKGEVRSWHEPDQPDGPAMSVDRGGTDVP
jgi:hypothetical protein